MSVKMIIFDLDGTLLDTSPGILESVRYAADKMEYPELPLEKLLTFIGPPLTVSFMRYYHCDENEAIKLTAAYREHYREGALLKSEPYNGILDLCRQLKDEGLILSVATSKPQIYSEKILQHFGFDKYISVIHGADMEWKLTKADLIRLCVGENHTSECIMVGDTEYDAKGAQEAGVPFLAVTYGFGDMDKMMSYPNIGVADKPADILEIVRNEAR